MHDKEIIKTADPPAFKAEADLNWSSVIMNFKLPQQGKAINLFYRWVDLEAGDREVGWQARIEVNKR